MIKSRRCCSFIDQSGLSWLNNISFTKDDFLLALAEISFELLVHFVVIQYYKAVVQGIQIKIQLVSDREAINLVQSFAGPEFFLFDQNPFGSTFSFHRIQSNAILLFNLQIKLIFKRIQYQFSIQSHMSFLIKYLFWDQQYIPYTQPPKPQPQPLTQKQKAIVVLKSLEDKITDFESKEIAMGVKMKQLKQSGIDYLDLGKKLEAKYALEQALVARNMAEGYKQRAAMLRTKWTELKQSIEDQQLVELMQEADKFITAPQAK